MVSGVIGGVVSMEAIGGAKTRVSGRGRGGDSVVSDVGAGRGGGSVAGGRCRGT